MKDKSQSYKLEKDAVQDLRGYVLAQTGISLSLNKCLKYVINQLEKEDDKAI
jgi:hypothetical protein